jgi:small conductance mechanosensitive channel
VLWDKQVLQDVIALDSLVLAEPTSEVYVFAHAESSIKILVRVWVKPENYWGVYFHMPEQVKLAFDPENITIPFPQRDVHMIPVSKTA